MTKKKLNLTHPTVYPLPMIIRIIKMATNPGDTILDPFAGSGTSLVAAKIMGRKAFGFDLDDHYYEEFERRLKTEGNMSPSTFNELLEDTEKAELYKKELSRVLKENPDQLKLNLDEKGDF